jgi:hypothetical protein
MTKSSQTGSLHHHAIPTLVAAALLPLCLTVGCAGSSAQTSKSQKPSATSTRLDDAFVVRAEKVCTPYMKYNSTHFFRVEGFNRFDPNTRLLDRVADYLSRNPSYRTLASDLHKLGEPHSGTVAWHSVMKDLDISQRLMANEIRSAHQGDAAAFTTYDARVTDNDTALHADLVKLGLSQGSACYGVQGDPFETAPRSE